MAKAKYDNNSIELLKGAERIRKRPAAILGSDGIEGCEHAFFEILSNSIDEAREGYGKVINVEVFRDHSVSVEDFGRGVPLGWNEKEQRYNWELVFCELYAGGKYHNTAGGDYEYSLGLNGLGACATQYSSEYMEVSVYTGEEIFHIDFFKGEIKGELRSEPQTGRKRTGTVIRWRPDLEVFTAIDMPLEFFTETLKKQAVVNDGLTLNLKFEDSEGAIHTASYKYENGILDYVREIAGQSIPEAAVDGEDSEDDSSESADEDESSAKNIPTIITDPIYISGDRVGRDREDLPEYKLKIQAAFCFANRHQRIEYYHNSSFLEFGGSPEKAVRSSFTKAIDNYLRVNNKYNKSDQKITFQDIEDCLILVTSSFSTQTSYLNQTKKAITNPFITEAMTEFFLHRLEVYFAENKADAERIATQVMINKRSRESAESARINIKKKLSGSLDISNRVEKFRNCRSKDPGHRELYIVEGDSALTSCVLGRNAEFQAIIPVRGKTLNCLKANYDKIFKNDIIIDLLKVIGCGVEIKSKSNRELVEFDISALKWNKIIICTDADEDGFQIRTLILTLFYRLLPTLIKEGRIFIAESPLYEITSKGEIYFAYDDKEKAEILEKIGDAKYTVQRSKGLGENEPEMMWKTTMCPATRRLVKIMPEDEEATFNMFNILLGDDLDGRKRFIAENGYKYIELADV